MKNFILALIVALLASFVIVEQADATIRIFPRRTNIHRPNNRNFNNFRGNSFHGNVRNFNNFNNFRGNNFHGNFSGQSRFLANGEFVVATRIDAFGRRILITNFGNQFFDDFNRNNRVDFRRRGIDFGIRF